MAYDEALAARIRKILAPFKKNIIERKMMGGLAFMLYGKMCCGVIKEKLMVRVVEKKYEESLKKPYCSKMDFTGKPLKRFLYVEKEGFPSDKDLKTWINLGVEFVKVNRDKN